MSLQLLNLQRAVWGREFFGFEYPAIKIVLLNIVTLIFPLVQWDSDVQLCTLFCGVWGEARKKIERDGESLLICAPLFYSPIPSFYEFSDV
uniref:Uncharacterized protein n=1 Tax=Cucumis melo TaxID=3656 RepID=A0A9I9E678_CUCME